MELIDKKVLDEFDLLIDLIGFKFNSGLYEYNEFLIDMWFNHYNFYNGSEWKTYYYDELSIIHNTFKKELRSYKLKHLLR